MPLHARPASAPDSTMNGPGIWVLQLPKKFNYRGLVIEAPFANGVPVLRQESKGVNMETATQVMDNQFIPCQPEVTTNPDHAAKAEEEIIATCKARSRNHKTNCKVWANRWAKRCLA